MSGDYFSNLVGPELYGPHTRCTSRSIVDAPCMFVYARARDGLYCSDSAALSGASWHGSSWECDGWSGEITADVFGTGTAALAGVAIPPWRVSWLPPHHSLLVLGEILGLACYSGQHHCVYITSLPQGVALVLGGSSLVHEVWSWVEIGGRNGGGLPTRLVTGLLSSLCSSRSGELENRHRFVGSN